MKALAPAGLLAGLLAVLAGCMSPKSQSFTLRGEVRLPAAYDAPGARAELTYLAPRRFIWLEGSPSPFDGSLARFMDRSSDQVRRGLPIVDGVVHVDRSFDVLWANAPAVTITSGDRPAIELRFKVEPGAYGEPARFDGFVVDLGDATMLPDEINMGINKAVGAIPPGQRIEVHVAADDEPDAHPTRKPNRR